MEQTQTTGWPGMSPSGTVALGGTPLPLVGRARVYACGITPYDVTHVGHAATFVWIDTLARVLRDAGADVVICRNVTDVDDVLLAAADRAGAPYDRFAAIQQFYFDRDMAALGVGQPAQQPRAHAYIGQAIALAAGLLERGAAYDRGGQVWFRGAAAAHAAVPDRGAGVAAGRGVRRRPGRRGQGRPVRRRGVAVVARRAARLGQPLGYRSARLARRVCRDGAARVRPGGRRAGGGGDLRFPHHACQAALAEAFTGVTPFARVRFNVGVVRVAGAKMAKSTGNLVLVSDLLKEHSAASVRLLILDRRWDEDWDFSPAALDAAETRLERLQAAAGRPDRGVAGSGAGGSGAAAVAATRAALAGETSTSPPRCASPNPRAARPPVPWGRCSASGSPHRRNRVRPGPLLRSAASRVRPGGSPVPGHRVS